MPKKEKTVLRPPDGYDSWLDYAVEEMPTRELFLESCLVETWGRVVQRHEFIDAAQEELRALRAKLTVSNWKGVE